MFRLGLRDAHILAPLMGLTPDDLTGLSNLHALLQLPGRSSFSVRFDPPQPPTELARYEPPAEIADDDKPATEDATRAHRTGEPRVDPAEELWTQVIDRLDPDLSRNPRRNWWLQSIVGTRITDDRFEVIFDSDIVCDWFSQCHLDRLQAVVDDIAYGAFEVVARSAARIDHRPRGGPGGVQHV